MTTLNRILLVFFLGVFFLSAATGCDDEDTGIFSVDMTFATKVGGQEFIGGDVYDINGVKVSFERVQYYVSGIRLVKANGEETSFNNYLLVSADSPSFEIGVADAGSYEKLIFNVGLDSVTNHGDPSLYPLSHPLGAKTPAMHWSWNSGYIFLRIDGFSDSDGDDIPDAAFEAHLGTDNLLRTVELLIDMEAADGDTKNLTVDLDVADLYTGVDMTGNITTHTMDNMPLAMTIAQNILSALTFAQ